MAIIRSTQHNPLGTDDTMRIVFNYLNERDRVRFLVTTKTLTHWLLFRRQVAHDTLVRLREELPALCFSHKEKREKSTIYHKYTVRLYRGDIDVYEYPDLGLMKICDSSKVNMWSGNTYDGDDLVRFFAPWMSRFVSEISDDNHALNDTKEGCNLDENGVPMNESLAAKLCRVSKSPKPAAITAGHP